MIRRRIVPALILLLLAGCSDRIEPGTRAGTPPTVTGLQVAQVRAAARSAGETLPGTIQRGTRTTLVARSDGRVSAFAVKEGGSVDAGRTLLTLVDNQAEARFQAARSALEAARAAEDSAEVRRKMASLTFERYDRLRKAEAVTPQEFDQVDTELQAARGAVARARAEVNSAEAALASARVARGYTVVTAPFAATVVRKETRDGATVLPGTPLVTLDRRDGWELLANVPESLWPRLAVGQEVVALVPALDLKLAGTVGEKLPAAEPGSRAFPVKVDLPSDDRLQSGMFARLVLPGGEITVLAVPGSALVERGQLTGVYLVEEGILRYRLVKTGRRLEGRVEILSGLEEGDRIIVGGIDRARDGARLQE